MLSEIVKRIYVNASSKLEITQLQLQLWVAANVTSSTTTATEASYTFHQSPTSFKFPRDKTKKIAYHICTAVCGRAFTSLSNANTWSSQAKEHLGCQIRLHGLEFPTHMLCTELANNNVPLVAREPAELGGWLSTVANGMWDDPINCIGLMYISGWRTEQRISFNMLGMCGILNYLSCNIESARHAWTWQIDRNNMPNYCCSIDNRTTTPAWVWCRWAAAAC